MYIGTKLTWLLVAIATTMLACIESGVGLFVLLQLFLSPPKTLTKSRIMVCSLYFLALLSLLPFISADDYIKPWTPVNISNPAVKAIGEFAVTEYNKRTTLKLIFQSLISGRYSLRGAGDWFELVIGAKNESLPSVANYLASIL